MINYIKGDATNPIGEGSKIIAHVVNDIGAWGRGFVLAISRRWTAPEECYRKYWRGFNLGQVQWVPINHNLTVANMFGQRGIGVKNGIIPLQYDALTRCLEEVARIALKNKASVHMPFIGCGLAGGDWNRVEAIINDTLVKAGVEVYVYRLR